MKWKTLLSLLLAAALLSGLLSGCQLSQADPFNVGDDNTPTTAETLPQTQPTYPKEQIEHFPWDGIPPYYLDLWQKGLNAYPNDTYYAVDLQWSFDLIELPDAWDITTGSSTIRVGVIDTGIDATHPELQDRINEELSESFISGYDPLDDGVGHGTHVAGIIGAQGNNSTGISGVCWDVELVSLRVTDDQGSFNMMSVVNAIKSANSKEIDILNISLGTNSEIYNTLLYNAIEEFNGLVVCSAGNYMMENDPYANNDTYPWYPGCLRLSNLISVGASTHADTNWEYSYYGVTSVDIFAPGSSILSCYPVQACVDGTCDTSSHNASGYHLMSGTSMAAPHVAGVAALLLSAHPELTAAELKQVIMSSVDIIYDDNGDSVFGDLCVSGGRLNAYAALTTSSIHNFGAWTDLNAAYHCRTCTTCGYEELEAHSDYWDAANSRCTVCYRTGMIINPYSLITEELCTETCSEDCEHHDISAYLDACA